MKPCILGLTGPTGAGKSTFSHALCRLGFASVDADRMAREVMEPGSPLLLELADRFGVMSIPTLVVLKNGEMVTSSVGVRPKNAILQMLEEVK